jgi:hypothetical protein
MREGIGIFGSTFPFWLEIAKRCQPTIRTKSFASGLVYCSHTQSLFFILFVTLAQFLLLIRRTLSDVMCVRESVLVGLVLFLVSIVYGQPFGCFSPEIVTYQQTNCSGTPSYTSYYDQLVCPRKCNLQQDGKSSFGFTCNPVNITFQTHLSSKCDGMAFKTTVGSSLCINDGPKSSYAYICDPEQPIRPANPNPPIPGVGWASGGTNCPGAFQCTPGVPFGVQWKLPNCRGPVFGSFELFGKVFPNQCYLLAPGNENLQVTCSVDKVSSLTFSSGCFASSLQERNDIPLHICINDLANNDSVMYFCGSTTFGKVEDVTFLHNDVNYASFNFSNNPFPGGNKKTLYRMK